LAVWEEEYLTPRGGKHTKSPSSPRKVQ